MRLQLALNVTDLEAAIRFYRDILGVEVHKREPGYASFVVEQPALKLVLFENPAASERLNHMGFEVFDDHDVERAAVRLLDTGVKHEREDAEVCCFARQNKVVTHDPDGLMWEWYRVLEDSPTFFETTSDSAPAPRACCS